MYHIYTMSGIIVTPDYVIETSNHLIYDSG